MGRGTLLWAPSKAVMASLAYDEQANQTSVLHISGESLDNCCMKLLLIRHAEAVYADTDGLTEVGTHQAQLLADRLALGEVDHLYSSPMPRATDTAGIISKYINLDATIEEELREINPGSLPIYWDEEKKQWRDNLDRD